MFKKFDKSQNEVIESMNKTESLYTTVFYLFRIVYMRKCIPHPLLMVG